MTVKEVIDELQKVPDKSIPVLFDTEAARFMQHMVDIDSVEYDPDFEKATGMPPYVGLHSRVPRQY